MPVVRAARILVLLIVAQVAWANSLPEIRLDPRGDVLRLAVTGDTGKGSEAVAKGIRRVHAAAAIHGIVLAGDTFYPCGVTSEKDSRWSLVAPLTRVGVPVLPVLGNHDSCGKADPDAQIRATQVLDHWIFPARQYVVRSKFADFVFLDTTPLAKGRSNSVAPAVSEAFSDSKAPWRIAVGHHPVISSGYHGYFPRDEVKRMRGLTPLLLSNKVDLFIAGHDHHMELIRGRMLHLISGAGSSPVPAIKLRVTTIYPTEIRRERIGFAIVEVRAKSIRVRFHGADGSPLSDWIPARTR